MSNPVHYVWIYSHFLLHWQPFPNLVYPWWVFLEISKRITFNWVRKIFCTLWFMNVQHIYIYIYIYCFCKTNTWINKSSLSSGKLPSGAARMMSATHNGLLLDDLVPPMQMMAKLTAENENLHFNHHVTTEYIVSSISRKAYLQIYTYNLLRPCSGYTKFPVQLLRGGLLPWPIIFLVCAYAMYKVRQVKKEIKNTCIKTHQKLHLPVTVTSMHGSKIYCHMTSK